MTQAIAGDAGLTGCPTGWESRRVAEMGSVLAGKALNVNGVGPLRPYLRTKNVLDGRIDLQDVLWMPMTDREFERFRIVNGDVLLNEGQSLELVGRCSIYRSEFGAPCAIQNQLLRFRAHEDTSPEFAAHLFRYCQQTGKFSAIATQTTSVAHLGSSRFSNLSLPWPTHRLEQIAIADALTDIDVLIANLEGSITKKQAIKQGMMQQLLTGKTRLSGFKGSWIRATFEGLAAPARERVDPRVVPADTPLVELEHIEASGGRLLTRATARGAVSLKTVFRPGDVLFGKLRAYLRKYWLADMSGICSTEIWALRAKPAAVAGYIRYLVETDRFIEVASGGYGTHMPRSDWGALRGLEIDVPTVDEQQAIASILQDADNEIEVLHRGLDKTRSIRLGMMQELLTGRTRLRTPEAVT